MKPLTMTRDEEAWLRSRCDCATLLYQAPWQTLLRQARREIDALRAALDNQSAEVFTALDGVRTELADLRAAVEMVMPVEQLDNTIPFTFIARLGVPDEDRELLTRMAHAAIETAAKVLRHELLAMPEDRRNFISSKLTIGAETYSLTYQREGGKTPADVIVERDAARGEVERLKRIADAAAEWRAGITRPVCTCDAASGCLAARMWEVALAYDVARGTP